MKFLLVLMFLLLVSDGSAQRVVFVAQNVPNNVFIPSVLVAPVSSGSTGQFTFPETSPSGQSYVLPAGKTLLQIVIQTQTAPAANQSLTMMLGCGTFASFFISRVWTVTLASTTAAQTFSAPSGLTIGTNCYVGFWVASGYVAPGVTHGGTNIWRVSLVAPTVGTYSVNPGGAGGYSLQSIISP